MNRDQKAFCLLAFCLDGSIIFQVTNRIFLDSVFAEALILTQAKTAVSKYCLEVKGDGLHHILYQLPPNGNFNQSFQTLLRNIFVFFLLMWKNVEIFACLPLLH